MTTKQTAPYSEEDTRFEAVKNFATQHGLNGEIQLCAQDMSSRIYYRLSLPQESFIIMDAGGTNPAMFITLSDFFIEYGIYVPKIFAYDATENLVLIEDFGDNTFSRILRENPERESELYSNALLQIKKFQRCPRSLFLQEYNSKYQIKEVDLFCDYYWPYIKKNKMPEIVRREFGDIITKSFSWTNHLPYVVIHKDFHVDNLMLISKSLQNKAKTFCGVLDFQDAMWGPINYDYISLTEDARVSLSENTLAHCEDIFLRQFSSEEKEIIEITNHNIALARHLRILGVFSRYIIKYNNNSKNIHHQRVWGYIQKHLESPNFAILNQWFAEYFPLPSRC